MWIFTTIFLVGMLILIILSVVSMATHKELPPWFRNITILSYILTLLGIMYFTGMTVELQEEKDKNSNKPKFELVQEPIYRKIK